MIRHLPGFLDITGVICRLPTAGLTTVEFHLHAELPENFHRAETHFGGKLVNQAGDEQRDFHKQLTVWPPGRFYYPCSLSFFLRALTAVNLSVLVPFVNFEPTWESYKIALCKVPGKAKKRICVLNGGGDCPGLNAAIRSVVKTAILRYGWEIWGSEDTFDGFLDAQKMVSLTVDSVRGILPRGGTILGTSNKGNPFRYPVRNKEGKIKFQDYSQKVIDKAREMRLDALIIIGGDGTLSIAYEFFQAGLPVIGVPKTIDKDLLATEITFGFDTALHTATDAIDKIHTTAESHDRVMVVELMGRNAGWIALEAGISGGADIILIPEIPFDMERVCQKIRERAEAGRPFSVVVVAEAAAPSGGTPVFKEQLPGKLGGVGFVVGEMIQEQTGVDTRVLVLGHLQRGGSPSPFDRLLGTRFGMVAVELAAQERFGEMVALRCGQIESVPIKNAIARQRLVDPDGEYVRAAKAIGISFGDSG